MSVSQELKDGQSAAAVDPSGARIDRTARWLLGLLAVVLLGMFARVVQLQAAPPKQLLEHLGTRTSVEVEPAKRGEIRDRAGRLIASSRFGWRVFVDPTRFPVPPDAAIMTLADAIGERPDAVGPRILEKMLENEKRKTEAGVVEKVDIKDLKGDAKKKVTLNEALDKFKQRMNGTEEVLEDPTLVRYISVGGVLDDAKVEAVKKLKISGVYLEARSVRSVAGEDYVASLLGKVGTDDKGLMGTEMVLNKALEPKQGRLQFVRDSKGRALWLEPGGYVPPERGADVRLAIDTELQRQCTEELERGVIEADAAGGRAVLMNPHTGEILALVDLVRQRTDLVDYDWVKPIPKDNTAGSNRYRTIREDFAGEANHLLSRNRCVEDVYEPGSTFKPFMWCATLELGLVKPEERFETFHGRWRTPYGREITDVVRSHEYQTWMEVLINSSNIGMAQGTSRMNFVQMRDAVLKFGFGKRPGTGLPGESPGLVTTQKHWSVWTQTSVAMGHEVAVTPVQMVRAFSAIARAGEMAGTLPQVQMEAIDPDSPDSLTRRILPREVAEKCRYTLRGVTGNLDKRLADRTMFNPPETGWKYELFGKSGTAEIPLGPPPKGKKRPKGSDGYFNGQYNSSFIAGGPYEDPRLVLLVVIDDPGPERVRTKNHYGAKVAGPVVRRTLERALEYLGVPASPPSAENAAVIPHAE